MKTKTKTERKIQNTNRKNNNNNKKEKNQTASRFVFKTYSVAQIGKLYADWIE